MLLTDARTGEGSRRGFYEGPEKVTSANPGSLSDYEILADAGRRSRDHGSLSPLRQYDADHATMAGSNSFPPAPTGARSRPNLGKSMAKEKARTFGEAIRARRRQLDLTQEDVARRIKFSVPYLGQLEAGSRRPSEEVLARLAQVLGLDCGELFFLVNPKARALLHAHARAPWDLFRRDEQTQRAHGVTAPEMAMLSQVAMMGPVRSARDFIYVLYALRLALSR
jgi:transcriptional regulator with XRE-family HTH domain